MAQLIKHLPCPKCGSSDANSEYDDGSRYCFSCEYVERGDSNERTTSKEDTGLMEDLVYTAIPKRGLTEE